MPAFFACKTIGASGFSSRGGNTIKSTCWAIMLWMSATCFDAELFASVITICQPHFAATSLKLLVSASRHGLLLSVWAKPTRKGFLFASLGRGESSAWAMLKPAVIDRASTDAASARSGNLRVLQFSSDSMSSSGMDGPAFLSTSVLQGFSFSQLCLNKSRCDDYSTVLYYWSIANIINYGLFCHGNYPYRCAFDQRSVELYRAPAHGSAGGAVVFFLEECLDGPSSQFIVGQHDGGQSRMRVPGDFLIVVAEYGYVFGYAQSKLLQRFDRAERHQIVRAENCCWRVGLAHQ